MKNSMDNLIYNIFLDLKHSPSKEYISVDSLPFSNHHKIGISADGYPLFFIKCDDNTKSIDINLEFISVQFNQVCTIRDKENITNSIYSIVKLKTINGDLQQYFINVFSIILQQLDKIPSESELYREVRKVIDLFSSINKVPIKSIQGLWAELLVIEKALNPEYLINSWHVSPLDKYDFNDGQDKLEVKSTSKSKRIHRFSIEQLNVNSGSNLLIASVFVIETGIGYSILNLRDAIISKVSDLNSQLRLNEIIYKTMGNEYEKIGTIYFDYQIASDSLSFYEVSDIPRIDVKIVPFQISNVTFDCDISSIPNVLEKDFDQLNSLLFKNVGL